MMICKHVLLIGFSFLIFLQCEISDNPLRSTPDRAILDLNGYRNQYRLVFVYQYEIYMIQSDGRGLQKLTDNMDYDHRPAWSPTGQEIVFQSSPSPLDSINIFKKDVSGGQATNLSHSDCFCADPAVSSDGQYVAFTRYCQNDTTESLMVASMDGRALRELVSMRFIDQPDWSPHGNSLIFSGSGPVNSAIFGIDFSGGNLVQLAAPNGGASSATWSPDGSEILYQSDSEIYVMNADGSQQTNLTRHPARDNFPVWSPDGKKILFLSDRDGDNDVYMMNIDGNGLKNLSDDEFHSFYLPTWSPDGSRVAYALDSDGDMTNDVIHILDVETKNYQVLTAGWISPQWNSNTVMTQTSQ